MTHKEKAMEVFWDKFNCSQAVFAAFSEEFGMSEEQALKVSLCFSGGMRKGEVCGAVSGALMVLGMKYSESGKDAAEVKAIAYQKASEFMDKFKNVNGSCICKEILGCDISTPEGMEFAREKNCFNDICPEMVESAVKILEEME